MRRIDRRLARRARRPAGTFASVQRQCARSGCSAVATATFTFDAREQTVWLDPPRDGNARAGELCERHAARSRRPRVGASTTGAASPRDPRRSSPNRCPSRSRTARHRGRRRGQPRADVAGPEPAARTGVPSRRQSLSRRARRAASPGTTSAAARGAGRRGRARTRRTRCSCPPAPRRRIRRRGRGPRRRRSTLTETCVSPGWFIARGCVRLRLAGRRRSAAARGRARHVAGRWPSSRAAVPAA